jgi:hypothetical protein
MPGYYVLSKERFDPAISLKRTLGAYLFVAKYRFDGEDAL